MFKSLYVCNLLEANYNGTAKWEDADLEAIVAKIEAGNDEKPLTLGQKIGSVICASKEVLDVVQKHWHFCLLDYRNYEAHEGVDHDRVANLSDEDIEAFESVCKVKVGKDYSLLPKFVELEHEIYKAVRTHNVWGVQNTLGQNVVFWRRNELALKRLGIRNIRWMWKLNNLRNKYVHTGKTLNKSEREFLDSIPARIAKLAK